MPMIGMMLLLIGVPTIIMAASSPSSSSSAPAPSTSTQHQHRDGPPALLAVQRLLAPENDQ
ncbi:hypothetical protein JJE66_03705 [Bradyrhizobium diazoefficiens]|uniref:hypothetical protein n=1 Tax=Bradyrhizobium diazoefficiens TaxID=1355477 RepID=UPI00190DBF69|nr:hypothetical protein [Bradyrhizobium diazoefficiens]MBK3660358.1 hypothetical protein [Bradyrhizobium diazoefficiens]